MLAPSLPTDQRVALTTAVIAVAVIVWAVAWTTAEGALRPQRTALLAGGLALLGVGAYVAIRLWV